MSPHSEMISWRQIGEGIVLGVGEINHGQRALRLVTGGKVSGHHHYAGPPLPVRYASNCTPACLPATTCPQGCIVPPVITACPAGERQGWTSGARGPPGQEVLVTARTNPKTSRIRGQWIGHGRSVGDQGAAKKGSCRLSSCHC